MAADRAGTSSRTWTGWWTESADNSSAAGITSAMNWAVSAASAHAAQSPASYKRQVSGSTLFTG